MIGHATSPDLIHWEPEPEILPKLPPPAWESAMGGNAPYVFAWDDRYWLFYSRYQQINTSGSYRDQQQIGLAISDDLFTWERTRAIPSCIPRPSGRHGRTCSPTSTARNAVATRM